MAALVDCKKRLFDDGNDDEHDDEVIEIKERNSVKKQKIVGTTRIEATLLVMLLFASRSESLSSPDTESTVRGVDEPSERSILSVVARRRWRR